MAVIEYMLEKRDATQRRWIPEWVGDRGHWYDPATETYVGWVDDVRDFYLPDTVVFLSKEDLVQRVLTMHASSPMMKMDPENPGPDNMVAMTEAEVRTTVEAWYDDFVAKNS
jgi:hypothetical protein